MDRLLVGLLVAALAMLVVMLALGDAQPQVGFLVWVPVAGAALLNAGRTALLGLVTVVLGLAASLTAEGFDLVDRAVRLLVLSGVCVGSVWLAHARTVREESLTRMTRVAEVAQRALMRTLPTAIGRVALTARYVSAAEEALVGGDLYEVAQTPYGVRVVVGDVRGKGLPAVGMAASVLSAFRVEAFREATLEGLARRLDEVVRREVDRTGTVEDFVTVLLLEIRDDLSSRVVSCGHHPPLLVGSGVQPLEMLAPNPPLGLAADPTAVDLRLLPGSRLLLFTDGLVEARNRAGAFFPYARAVAAMNGQELSASLDLLVDQLMRHVGGRLSDDLALVLLELR